MLSYVMTPLMALEILVAEMFVAKNFEKKNNFYLRFFGSIAVMLFLTVWIEVIYFLITGNQFNYGAPSDTTGIIFKMFYYLIIFVMTVFCLWFSYDQSFILFLVCGSIGYAIQYLASSSNLLLSGFIDKIPQPYYTILSIFIWLITRLVVYFIVYKILKDRRFEEEYYQGNNRSKVVILFLVILVFICLSRLIYDDPAPSTFAKIAEPLYAILCSSLILAIQLSMSKIDYVTKELLDVKELLSQERKQYLLTKENIEIINEKCHDLKHQISILRENKSDKYISQIENAIMIYDSTVKTGSNVLDTLLTEKKLQCEPRNIKLTTVVNGKLLEFMDEMDVYSLFGNALSNAIESVSSFEMEEKRHIAITVKRIGDMCSIHIENPYEGEIQFIDDLPQTSKDKKWHGYGMKSMNRIVSSYDGIMSCTAKDGLFALDILIPIA